MAKAITHAIPSEFIRLDDAVTAADSYVNVRDLQTMQGNHNIMLARAARRPVGSFTFGLNGQAFVHNDPDAINSLSLDTNTPALRFRAMVSQFTRQLYVFCSAELVSAFNAECRVHVTTSDMRRMRRMQRPDGLSFTVDGVVADVEGTVDLPHTDTLVRGMLEYDISVHVLPELTSTNRLVGAPVAIGSSTTNSVTCASAGLVNVSVGDVITPANQVARVVESISSGGGNTTLNIYGRWDTAPTTQLERALHVPYLKLRHLTICEERLDDFARDQDRV